ncbi:Hypothetical_protein [Hexamita inflata]|uniref:Hypothetical_protein n=1 Tax=Hexamita inflata TaxID=28002 RepID=A0AA86P1K4_9EUKA|nr:Hypothetical protein HINF_LOCUS16344 [Hexamita inflata]
MSVLMRRENTLIIEPGSDISKIQIINFILLPNSKKHFEGPPLYQFCDKVYCFNQKYIYTIEQHLKLKQIFYGYYIAIIVHKGAVVVFKCHYPNGQQIYALNMIDGRINTTRNYFDIHGLDEDPNLQFNFGESGLQFNDEILTELFGKGTSRQINEYYKAYSKHTNICLDIALDYSIILFQESNQNNQYRNNQNRYETMYRKINKQLAGVNKRIKKLALLQQSMVSKMIVDINAQ